MRKNQHVVKRKNGWAVKGEKNKKATRIVHTQKEAIEIAKEIAKNKKSEVIIHGCNNLIRDCNSYGNDPYPPKG